MLLKTSLRTFFAHKGRMVLSLIAVVLSVAFVSGTLVFSNTATGTFDRLFASTASDISVQQAPVMLNGKELRDPGKVLTVPVDTAAKVAALPGVKSAVGQVFTNDATLVNPATNKAVGPTSGAPTITGNWAETPRNSVEITSGQAPRGDRAIMLDADTAKKAGLGLGSPLRVITAGGNHDFTISGIVTFKTTNPGAALAFMDTETAQKDLIGATAYTSVEAYGDGSRTDEQLKADALGAFGSGYQVKTAQEQKDENNKDVGSFLDFMKYAMLGFALVSLLVGGFLIINTFSMLVAQRTREIGLLRAIGGSRRQVNQSVLIEALFLGVLGSTLGLAAGLGLAEGLIQLMKAVGMNLSGADLRIGASVPLAAYGVGIVITVLAAWIPARRAGSIAPMAALRDHGTPSEARANRIRTALGLLLSGGGAALLVLASGTTTTGTAMELLGLGVLLTLVGFVVLGPLLATTVVRVLGALLPALFGPSGRLAQRNAMRNPRRTGATAAALMIGLALVIGASVFTSSAVASTNAQVDKSVGADYVVNGGRAGLTPAMLDAIKGTPDWRTSASRSPWPPSSPPRTGRSPRPGCSPSRRPSCRTSRSRRRPAGPRRSTRARSRSARTSPRSTASSSATGSRSTTGRAAPSPCRSAWSPPRATRSSTAPTSPASTPSPRSCPPPTCPGTSRRTARPRRGPTSRRRSPPCRTPSRSTRS